MLLNIGKEAYCIYTRLKIACHLLAWRKKIGQANGLVSNGQLHALLRFHLHPINHVVYMESHWDTLS